MRSSLTLLLALLSLSVHAQNWELVQEIPLGEQIVSYAKDSDNKIYVGTESGQVHRLNSYGEPEETFSDPANTPVTMICAWNRLQPFLFMRDQQQFVFLDRFMTTPVYYDLSEFTDNYIWLATPGVDQSVWLINGGANELMKFNIQTKQQLFSIRVNADLGKATYARALQNLLIVADSTVGLRIFDRFGNYLKMIDARGIRHFHVVKNTIYGLADQGIISVDPFRDIAPQTQKAPDGAFRGMIKSDNQYFFIGDEKVFLYRQN